MGESVRTEANDARGAAGPERTIVQEREFDAPRELVWQAWTDARHVDQWWGPNGFRNQTSTMDVRVGGEWRYVMHAPDGKAWPNWVRYEEVRAPERLVYSHGGEGDEPHFHVTVTFATHGARTKVTMVSVFPTADACAAVKKFGAVEGGQQTLARLAGFLPYLEDRSAERAMVLTRLFDAPVELVFGAWSKAEALTKWWGPKVFHTPIVEIDFRVGGAYRMVMRDPAGNDYPFHGHYREVVPNRRIVFDAVIDHASGDTVLTTVTFDDEGGKTRLTVRQDRPADPRAASGQTEGWSGSFDKLAAVLAAA